ncbi:alpha beta-hydrolase [Scleroderma citrinum]
MNHVSFPIQLVTLIRRLVNVISTISLTNQYLLSRIQAQNHIRDDRAGQPGSYSRFIDRSQPPSYSRWKWLTPGYTYDWSGMIRLVCSNDRRSRDALRPGSCSEHTSGPSSDATFQSPSTSRTSELQFNASALHIRATETTPPSPKVDPDKQDTIHRLMNNPTLFDPLRLPRYPIVLCHGLYGFDVRGPSAFPSLRYHYWSNVLDILKKRIGADVIVTAVPGTGSIASRAETLDRILQQRVRGRGVNLLAHSMGGLDCRHLITHIQPTKYAPLSLTSISTPHRGSPFMDWCAKYLGLGRRTDSQVLNLSETLASFDNKKPDKPVPSLSLSSLPSSFTTLILSYLDSPAYANLTTSYLNDVFNPTTPDDPRVKYFSVVSRIDEVNIWHPLWLPKMVLDDAERTAKESLMADQACKSSSGVPLWEQDDQWGNDGLVTVQSARWGEFLGILEGCDHWDVRGWRGSFMELTVDFPSLSFPLGSVTSGEGWALGDWTRFIGVWRKQEGDSEGELQMSTTIPQVTETIAISSARETATERKDRRQRDQDDPVVKASTDQLSAVFDWIVEQTPSPGSLSSSGSKVASKKPRKKDLATKTDLERFYVSLARKLYDEGL